MASPAHPAAPPPTRSAADAALVLLAQGFGTGRSPVAPGTVGSVLGLGWCGLLAWSQSMPLVALGIVAACLAAVPICGRAETLLGQKDPGSVVLDEMVALPLCYLGVWCLDLFTQGQPPAVAAWLHWPGCGWLGAGFVLFRALDALKPPPIGACQRLPGGWGIVVDDVVAACITGLLLGAARWLAAAA